jgi:hypothetical protein
MYVYSIIGI